MITISQKYVTDQLSGDTPEQVAQIRRTKDKM